VGDYFYLIRGAQMDADLQGKKDFQGSPILPPLSLTLQGMMSFLFIHLRSMRSSASNYQNRGGSAYGR
jgi:hypothetical protein